MATEATLLQAAASTAIAAFGKDGGRKAMKEFTKLVTRLSGDDPASQKTNMADLVGKEQGRNGAERR